MTIGERIKIIRKERGITQKQLCELSGVPTSSIGRYENGETSPTVDALEKIAQAFGLSVAALVDSVCFIKESAEYAETWEDIPRGRILWLALRGINAQISEYLKCCGEWDMDRVKALKGLVKEKEIVKGKLKGIGEVR